MRRVAIFIGLAILALALACGNDDDRVFTDKSIEGRWGFSVQGMILPPALPAPTPAVAVGILDFDGSGGCSITDTTNLGGTKIGPQTSETCTYSVNPDGTGTFSVAFPGPDGAPGPPAPISFVIVNKEKEIRTIRTDLGVATGVAKRQ